jgi:hypothetical protein
MMEQEVVMQKYFRRGFMSNFEKFTHRKSRSFGKPMITITKDGNININSVTMEKYVKDNNFAVLYYDKNNYLIGVKFSDKEKPESYKIRKSRNDRLGYLTGIAFLKYYNINHDKTFAYTVEWNEQEKMIVIDLKEHWEDDIPADDEVPF